MVLRFPAVFFYDVLIVNRVFPHHLIAHGFFGRKMVIQGAAVYVGKAADIRIGGFMIALFIKKPLTGLYHRFPREDTIFILSHSPAPE